MNCNYCNKKVNDATGLFSTGTIYGSVCDDCYQAVIWMESAIISKGEHKNMIHIHADYDGNTRVDLQDCRILIAKFCKQGHNPKKAFSDYFQQYIDTGFKQEHTTKYYLRGKGGIYKHDENYIYFKGCLCYVNDYNGQKNYFKYDLLAPYYDFLEFIICLETKQKINEILFNREQENLKPKILQRSLF